MSRIKRGLDTGVAGVMIPMINTKEEAERSARSCKYPPVGVRGTGAGKAVIIWSSTRILKLLFTSKRRNGSDSTN